MNKATLGIAAIVTANLIVLAFNLFGTTKAVDNLSEKVESNTSRIDQIECQLANNCK